MEQQELGRAGERADQQDVGDQLGPASLDVLEEVDAQDDEEAQQEEDDRAREDPSGGRLRDEVSLGPPGELKQQRDPDPDRGQPGADPRAPDPGGPGEHGEGRHGGDEDAHLAHGRPRGLLAQPRRHGDDQRHGDRSQAQQGELVRLAVSNWPVQQFGPGGDTVAGLHRGGLHRCWYRPSGEGPLVGGRPDRGDPSSGGRRAGLAVLLDQVAAQGLGHGGGPVGRAELLEDVLEVGLDRVR
jgi:hypothetical protein